MNAPALLSRRTASVCFSCRLNLLRRRQFSTSPASLVAAFQAYTLPSQPPPTPRNAAAADISIQSPNLPRIHETRPPKQEETKSAASQQAQQQPTETQTQPSSSAAPPTSTTLPAAKPTPRPRPKLRARKAAINLTPGAVEHLRELLDQPDPKLIKVGVRNRGCSGLAYHLEYVDKAGAFDETVEQDGVKVLIDSKALFSIIGSEMDWVEDKLSQRFVFRNPNIMWMRRVVHGMTHPSRGPSAEPQGRVWAASGATIKQVASPTSPAKTKHVTASWAMSTFLPKTIFNPPFSVMVVCPICNQGVKAADINSHIDSGCQTHILDDTTAEPAPSASPNGTQANSQSQPPSSTQKKRSAATFFQTPAAKRQALTHGRPPLGANGTTAPKAGLKRSYDEGPGESSSPTDTRNGANGTGEHNDDAAAEPSDGGPRAAGPSAKRSKNNRNAPLAERMRPDTLDDVFGQDLVGPNGVLRSMIESDRLPSMILWGGSGTGKTTIARCIARRAGSRFIELNATSTGVAECKKLFAEAANELALTGRRTIIFCDEIHRFNKGQQDVFLKPVEAGTITLIGATTENPSFRVQAALLSRCRTFTLQSLTKDDIQRILLRALEHEVASSSLPLSPLIDPDLLSYLASFSDGDARTALNLLELALSLTTAPPNSTNPLTKETIKSALTKTLVYDRAGDQHYDTISAFHKSVRGSDADAALYYLARMLQSGEDPLFIARRMVVIASEDIGLADNTLLPLATATYTATQQIGLPEARIPLAHCAVALCLAPKSTRAYRGLNNALSALQEPGVAALPVPVHLRNAPTRLMREMGYGREYKYPPNYVGGRVRQEYLPEGLGGRKFLEERDLGTEVDGDFEMGEGAE
ncbi:hypothetical protein C8A05DRAFT_45810 [Staphylotrichum tortipilum]|uniref:UBZ4-type domain-containing protein n=1 Tax=Staphylotrichum tortipilum TaxID=2831512 RepID=A0AAN6MHQ7_9PEZI|nr:hypothetical protein C8A05DRAFT_45810 [Staphylotrichum longicolle]